MGKVCDAKPEDVESLDIDSPIEDARAPVCEYFRDGYGRAAKIAEDEGRATDALLYRFLIDLLGVQLKFDTPGEPFSPRFPGDKERSIIPYDLDDGELEIVSKFAEKTKSAAIKAKLHDFLWERKKDHVSGKTAAEQYFLNASELVESENWLFAPPLFQRGLDLARKFGREKPLFSDGVSKLLEAVDFSKDSKWAFYCSKLLQVCLNSGIGDPNALALISKEVADTAVDSGDFNKAEEYFSLQAEFLKEARDPEGEKEARIAAGETMVKEAERAAEAQNYFSAVTKLSPAIECLRRAGCDRERIRTLRAILYDWQQKSVDSFQSYTTETNISELVSSATKHVSGFDLRESIQRLAFMHRLDNPEEVKKQVLDLAQKAPLSSFMDGVIVDTKGRTTAHKKGLLNLEGEELENELEKEAFAYIADNAWPLLTQAYLQPARRQIVGEHQPSIQDLSYLVSNNPFIPAGHEWLFLKGIHAGFHGDFVVSSHLLAVQIENSIRHVLESRGVDVSNLNSDLTQPVKLLGPLFDLPETAQIFGEDLCFNLRCLLIEKRGASFRNNIAHGFAGIGECYSPAAIITWWITIRICLLMHFRPSET